MKTLHTEKHFLQTFELDCFSRMPISLLSGILGRAAENHAEALGFGVEQLQKEKLTWMLLRLSIRQFRIVEGRQHLTIETWPSGCDARFAYREFRVFTEGNREPVAVADSHWLMIDIESGRPVRLEEKFTEEHLDPRGRSDGPGFPAIRPVEQNVLHAKDFTVRFSDIDVNNHVHNPHYINWIRETVPDNFLMQASLYNLDIEYRQGAVFGNTVKVRTFTGADDKTMLHTLHEKTDGSLLARARTEWSFR